MSGLMELFLNVFGTTTNVMSNKFLDNEIQ